MLASLGWCLFSYLFLAANADNASSCLPGATSAADRKNVSIGPGNAKMPLKLAYPGWVSGKALHHAARIVLQEKVGINTIFAESVSSSVKIWMQAADCNTTNPDEKCVPMASGSVAHLGFEIWESYALGMEDKLKVEVPERTPFIVGDLGAMGTEAFFIDEAVIKNASNQNVFLRWYESYNVTWSPAYEYFGVHVDLPIPDTSCESVYYMQGVYLDDYVRLTGDNDIVTEDGIMKRRCHQGWALSPACRELMARGKKGCVPAISYGGWGMHDLAQKAHYYNMPLAIGAFNWDLYIDIPKSTRTFTYWWTPDVAFLVNKPIEVEFPAYDPDEYGQGIYRTAMVGTPLLKVSSAAIANEFVVQKFVKQLKISIQSFMGLTTVADGHTDEELEAVTCKWMQENTAVWEKWVPDPTACIAAQGLTDRQGAYLTNASGAAGCEYCPPGRRSDKIQTATGGLNYICKSCATGYFQIRPGQTACDACKAGTSASEEGQSECSWCSAGKYAPGMNMSSCYACPVGFTTASVASVDVSQCLCAAGTYLRKGGATCTPCKDGMTCPLGSAAVNYGTTEGYPLLKPGFWSDPGSPLSVFQCENEKKCPGGDPGTCGHLLEKRSCAQCQDGYQWTGEVCGECSSVEMSKLLYPVIPCILMPIVISVMYKLFGDTMRQWGSYGNGIATVTYLLLSHYQVLDMVGAIQTMPETPSILGDTLSIWEWTNNLASLLKADCAGFKGFSTALIGQVLIPVLLLVLTIVLYGTSQVLAKAMGSSTIAMEKNRLFNVFMSLIFTFFNAIAALSLSLFKCSDNPNSEKTLAADYSIVCGDDEWTAMFAVAVIATLVYIIGFSSMLIWVILRAKTNMHDTGFQMRWKFLFIKFRLDIWWWALIYLARAFLYNMGFVIFFQGIEQLIWLMALTVTYSCALVIFLPYRHRITSVVDGVVCLSVMFCCVFKMWFAPRVGEDIDDSIAWAIIICSFSPLLIGGCVALYYLHLRTVGQSKLLQTMKNEGNAFQLCVTTLAEHDRARLIFELLSEWDRWYAMQTVKIVNGERALGMVGDQKSSELIRSKDEVQQGQEFVASDASKVAADVPREEAQWNVLEESGLTILKPPFEIKATASPMYSQ